MFRSHLWRVNSCLANNCMWSSVIAQTCFFQKLLCDLLTSQQSSCESSIMFKHWYGVYQRLLKCQPSNKGWGAVSAQPITGVTLNPTEWITRAFTTQDPIFMFFLGSSPFLLTGTGNYWGKREGTGLGNVTSQIWTSASHMRSLSRACAQLVLLLLTKLKVFSFI